MEDEINNKPVFSKKIKWILIIFSIVILIFLILTIAYFVIQIKIQNEMTNGKIGFLKELNCWKDCPEENHKWETTWNISIECLTACTIYTENINYNWSKKFLKGIDNESNNLGIEGVRCIHNEYIPTNTKECINSIINLTNINNSVPYKIYYAEIISLNCSKDLIDISVKTNISDISLISFQVSNETMSKWINLSNKEELSQTTKMGEIVNYQIKNNQLDSINLIVNGFSTEKKYCNTSLN